MVDIFDLGDYSENVLDVTPWASEALTSGTAVYSQAIKASDATGYAAIVVVLNGASDDVDVLYETSINGIEWYGTSPGGSPPNQIIDTSGTDINTIYEALGQGTHWIPFDPPMSRWIRFKFDPNANSTITKAFYIQGR